MPTADLPLDIVVRFLELASGNPSLALKMIDDNVVYTSVSLPTVYGKANTGRIVNLVNSRYIKLDVLLLNAAADGHVVLTERIDELRFGPHRMQFWVCSRFEVSGGRIVLWRDYFDWFDIAKAWLRGFGGILVPAWKQQPLSSLGHKSRT